MRTYECTILVNAARATAELEASMAHVRGLYEQEGAEWLELERWEERRLAYKIADQTSAVYLVGFFKAPSEAIDRIERRCRLDDLVLRQLIITRDGNDFTAIREQRARAIARAREDREEASAASAGA